MGCVMDWNTFRKNERVIDFLVNCADCGGPSEGNVTIEETNESICDACNKIYLDE